jgi:hypothetical protein
MFNDTPVVLLDSLVGYKALIGVQTEQSNCLVMNQDGQKIK